MTGETFPPNIQEGWADKKQSKYARLIAAGFKLADVVVVPKIYNQMSEEVRVIDADNPVVTYESEEHKKAAAGTWFRISALQKDYRDVDWCEVPEGYVNDALSRTGSNSPYARIGFGCDEHRLVLVRCPVADIPRHR